jgi:hydroxycarboxylate dehydrogenase B
VAYCGTPILVRVGVGLALLVEVLAGTLAGGSTGHPDNPTADRPINAQAMRRRLA